MTKYRGVFEKVPGSGIWWIRFVDGGGKLRRECVGTWCNARDLYHQRKNEARGRKKLPEKLNRRIVSFCELADDAREYVKARYSRPTDDVARLVLLKSKLSGNADAITPGQIEKTLDLLAL